jgi:hypothetical protein
MLNEILAPGPVVSAFPNSCFPGSLCSSCPELPAPGPYGTNASLGLASLSSALLDLAMPSPCHCNPAYILPQERSYLACLCSTCLYWKFLLISLLACWCLSFTLLCHLECGSYITSTWPQPGTESVLARIY